MAFKTIFLGSSIPFVAEARYKFPFMEIPLLFTIEIVATRELAVFELFWFLFIFIFLGGWWIRFINSLLSWDQSFEFCPSVSAWIYDKMDRCYGRVGLAVSVLPLNFWDIVFLAITFYFGDVQRVALCHCVPSSIL